MSSVEITTVHIKVQKTSKPSKNLFSGTENTFRNKNAVIILLMDRHELVTYFWKVANQTVVVWQSLPAGKNDFITNTGRVWTSPSILAERFFPWGCGPTSVRTGHSKRSALLATTSFVYWIGKIFVLMSWFKEYLRIRSNNHRQQINNNCGIGF